MNRTCGNLSPIDREILSIICCSREALSNTQIAIESNQPITEIQESRNELKHEGFIDELNHPTDKALKIASKPKNAIILAAGIGMRMVPVTLECPKALVSIKGEVLIERLINQLHEVGIYEIEVVVGFMKERFEYLEDEFNVKLVVNPDYRYKNNLHSLNLVNDSIQNTYIVPGDIWCRTNPFRKYEFHSWYMVTRNLARNSFICIREKCNLALRQDSEIGNQMIGISYISKETASILKKRIQHLSNDPLHDTSFWEEGLILKSGKLIVSARIVSEKNYIEINTYDDLRNADSDSDNLNTQIIELVCKSLGADKSEVSDVRLLKKGMTNKSFIFSCKQKKYIMRIPGEGTQELIDRKGEALAYSAIKGLHLSDNVIYINSESGYKLSEYIENSRTCNPSSLSDIKAAMSVLRDLHQQSVHINKFFNLFGQIDFYESLLKRNSPETVSMYGDYSVTKKDVLSLRKFMETNSSKAVLCHIDPVPDNFLFTSNICEAPRLIDWEYAGMADYHIDIAMFCIYTDYSKQEIDNIIDLYYGGSLSDLDRALIYCYIAACGLLWSNWCEYKQSFGVDFGEYAIYQYRYAKTFSKIASNYIIALGEDKNEQN